MVRTAGTAGLVAVTVVLAGLVGCGPGKELPDEPINPTSPRRSTFQVPSVSEAAAKKVYEEAVRAITGGNPALREKAKTSRVLAVGEFVQPNRGVLPDTGRRLSTVWPDRLHWVYDFKGGPRQTVWVRGTTIATHNGISLVDIPSLADAHRAVMADLYAQHYFPLGLPVPDTAAAGESKVIVHGLKLEPDGAHTVQALVDRLPPFQLTFDPKTNLLQKVGFTTTSVDVTVRSVVVLSDYRTVDGLVLPFRIEHIRNGESVERWKVETWEFPGTIDDAEFTPPKQ